MATRATETGRPELADVFRSHGHRLNGLSEQQRRAAAAIVSCRTAALGGHLRECDHGCGHQEISYNSCRNRHCPKCQGLERIRWQEARAEDLLPVPYFHLVFTIPSSLHDLFLRNSRVAYGLLFTAVADTLKEVASNPENLGAEIGMTTVLHTSTQTLLYHPHLHCIVPGGGLDPARGRFIAARENFFLTYLGRYTHRIAIGNERIVSMDDEDVTFAYKDRADGNQHKLLTLSAEAFLRRFLLHVLPRGLVRIRHYGFLANSVRRKRIALCRQLLGIPQSPAESTPLETWEQLLLRVTGKDVTRCPGCGKGRLRVTRRIEPTDGAVGIEERGASP